MKDLTKIYINLSKLSAEEIIKIENIIKYEISRINEYPFLIFSFDVWNQCGETSPLLGNKTELIYPEFIKLFEGGEEETFPTNVDIWKWWETQKFQKEQGEQEYTMIYEIDLPKILKSFFTHFNLKTKDNGNT